MRIPSILSCQPRRNPKMFGYSYTQLTDVEQEQNGIFFYDRAPKYEVARLRAMTSLSNGPV